MSNIKCGRVASKIVHLSILLSNAGCATGCILVKLSKRIWYIGCINDKLSEALAHIGAVLIRNSIHVGSAKYWVIACATK